MNYRDLLYKEIQNINFETPFQSDQWLTDLPLIICGPILRKVYYDSVSVWFAFKEEVKDIKLEVFESGNPSVNIFKETKAPLIKLGKNLFVTLVTAINPSKKLVSDTIYGYNLSFTHQGKKKQLKDSGVLKKGSDGIDSIAYKPYDFPTFCLPSDNLNNLKIAHGSCRLPHGGKTDALRAVDTMIETTANMTKERPQLLFLTGDQIYADEVADSLLYLMQKTASKLFGWNEKLPQEINLLQPGWRLNNINQSGFTTGDKKSHLITFQEYLLMYLFSFSDVLWTEKLPKIEELHPSLIKQNQNVKQAIEKRFSYINNELKSLQSFLKCLPFVRKALANISTLMIFDDHEITDDWHIDKKWNNNVLKNQLGRRIILNGLLAYSVFQDWGNDYVKYSTGQNADLLNALNEISSKGYPNNSITMIEKLIVPQLVEEKDKSILKSNFNWHYFIEYNSFNIFCLDTRTKRAYLESEKPLGNLVQSIGSQFAQSKGKFDSNKLLVLVSAAPVFGNVPLEEGQEKVRKGEFNLTGIASRGVGLVGRLKGSIGKSLTGMYKKDQEAWIFSTIGFESLLIFLSFFKKTLIISGDVHHSLTSYVRLYQKGDKGYKLSEIVQVTSSGLKRTTEEYHYPSTNKFPYELRPRTDKPYNFIKVTGKSYFKNQSLSYENKFYELDNIIFGNKLLLPKLGISKGFQFSVKFIKSTEKVEIKFAETLQEKVAKFIRNKSEVNSQKTAVGKDNISLVSFTPNSIINEFWYANGDEEKPSDKESSNLLLPFTTHRIEFNNRFKEEELPINELMKKLGRNASVTVK